MVLRQNTEFWRRRQRISAKRKKFFPSKQILLFLFFFLFIGLFSFGLVKLKNFTIKWDFLKIRDVKVHAKSKEIKNEIEGKIRNNLLGSILYTDTGKMKEFIMRNPYIKDVKIKKVLPSTIEVFVEERKGIAIAKDSKFYILDENGEIIKETEEIGSLPLIKGVSLDNKIAMGIAISFVREIKSLGYDKYLEEVDFSNPFNVGVKIKDSSVKVYLGDSDFIDKFQRFLAIEKMLKEEFGQIEYAGFYDKERVYLKISRFKEGSQILDFQRENKIGSLR
jgi:cell division protein FtsQ